MTNVFKDPSTGEIIVMCKGADSIILPLLNEDQGKDLIDSTCQFMDDCAKEGLRTLLFAEKIMTEREYKKWLAEYNEAANSMVDRDDRIADAAAKLEFDFNLVGSTALEDRLQDEVPETIEHIRKAGIKLWVLTGDKIETAINIGYSCRLLDDGINQYLIDADNSHDVGIIIDEHTEKQEEYERSGDNSMKMGVIVSGAAL